VDYRDIPQWSDAVREITGGRGVDHIVEVGGAGTMGQSIKSAALEAQIALVGGLAPGSFDGRALNAGVYSLHRIAVGSRTQFEAMNRAIDFHKARPLIDRVFDFNDAREAFEYFMTREQIGKVVISVS
jgi:NADPH:quinone reductase-like Zn-dependent oxidoreductase